MEEQVYDAINAMTMMEKAVGYTLYRLFVVSLPLAIKECISLRKVKNNFY